MFTGIVEKTAPALLSGKTLVIEADLPASLGDSIAVSGVCLTLRSRTAQTLIFDLADETLARTTLGTLTSQTHVNLERALEFGGRVGGHLVQGHVDGVGEVLRSGQHFAVRVPRTLARYCVTKGSIAIHGVSLTIHEILGKHEDELRFELVPFTLEATNLGSLKAGDPVNLEVDLMARYAEKLWNRQ